MENERTRVNVVGASNMDICASSNHKLIKHDSNIGRISMHDGGVGRNIASCLNALDVDVGFMTALADDEFGRIIESNLEKSGIRTILPLFPESNGNTGTYCCVTDVDGTLAYGINDMGLTARITPMLIEKHAQELSDADFLVFEANLPKETIQRIGQLDVPLVADCVSTVKCKSLEGVLEELFLLKANYAEACTLAGVDPEKNPDGDALDEVMKALVSKGLRRAIVSLGSRGAFCFEMTSKGVSGYELANLEGQEVVNTNGCGDALLSGFLKALSQGFGMKDALAFGQASAYVNASCDEALNPELTWERLGKEAVLFGFEGDEDEV